MNEDTKMILAEMKAMEDRLNARMDSMDAKMDKGFADVRSEMNTLSGRMDSLDAKMDKGFADIRNEMTNIIAEVCDAVSITVKATEDRLSERIDALAAAGIPVEFHHYPTLGHGFGLGIGTEAEGWLEEAVAFWEAQM